MWSAKALSCGTRVVRRAAEAHEGQSGLVILGHFFVSEVGLARRAGSR